MVRAGSPLELADEVADRDAALAAGQQIAQQDLSLGELVAHDDREMGSLPGRRLEGLAEAASPELGPNR
jgi:hypothetical protein